MTIRVQGSTPAVTEAMTRHVHCRTWNMARKLKIMENEKHPLDDLKNDEITKIREK